MARRSSAVVRKVLPWVAAWVGLQAVIAVAARLAARRLNVGDEGSAEIRRVLATGGLELRPTNPALREVRIDLAMGGADLDLGALRASAEGGPSSVVDVRVGVLMGGVAVRVPPDWRVWTSFRGIGGIGVAPGLQRAADAREADLRVHGRVLFGGIGVETSRPRRDRDRGDLGHDGDGRESPAQG